MLILLLSGLFLIVLLEAPRLLLKKMWKELIVFLGLWAIASSLAVAQFIGVDLPNPTDILHAIFLP
ncbi:hypothetical protein [Dethiobacter alkaliphilus]|uniref:Conserved hypothetical membrane protein n=1 Tax=Dethiobacter alkaliphilus AHT 1 TaxID=555088 RepID=C0GEP6_DETAL|nr:hypothetical protein [Dethiobacter alkaliphilus]EEG78078.1 conserved hypothetical membrane protein [Dethiobacter alkaliphilus AHT 1]